MILVLVCVGYVVLLAVLGLALGGHVASQLEERMAAALDAEVSVGSASIDLVRGRVALREVAITRHGPGHLELTIAHAWARVAPLGGVVFDREPGQVGVRGAALSLSARGVLGLPRQVAQPAQPARTPLRMGGLHLEDVRLVAMPTALLPGVGRIEVLVTEAHTGPVALRSSLDWLFAVRAFHAQAELPGEVDAEVGYRDGTLSVRSSWLGAEPVTMPFALPTPEPNALEQDKLRILVREVVRAIVSQGSGQRSWLRDKIQDRVLELLDERAQ